MQLVYKMSTDEYLSEIVAKIAKKENYEKFEYVSQPGSNKGDNYLSVLYIVTINGVTKFGENKQLDLIIKCALPGKKIRETFPVNEVFKREIFFYEEICKAFDEFQSGLNDKFKFTERAKVYLSSDVPEKEFIAMGNLKEEGFCLFDRCQSMTEEHVNIVMKTYGKLHGLSLALKEKDEATFNKLRTSAYDHMAHLFERSALSFQKEIERWLEHYNDDSLIISKLQFLKANIRDRMKANKNYKGDHPVFLHADCWCNNFLFKNKDSTHPQEVKLVDFQISRVSNPANDLTYFLYSCTESNIFNNYKKYLKVYYDSMADLLKAKNLSIEELLPFETLLEYWKTYSPLGIIISSVILRVNYTKPEEAINLEDVSDGNLVDALASLKIGSQDKVVERQKKLIEHMVDNDFI